MRKPTAINLFVGFTLLALSACSSSQLGEGEVGAEEFPVADAAGTDAVPMDGAELPPADAGAVDPNAAPPPVDMAGMPADTGAAPVDPMSTPPADPMAAAPVESTPSQPSSFSGTGETGDYKVQEGDTLMKIAFENYGDLYQWRKIYEANRDKISDPNSLPKGVSLKLERSSSPVAVDKNGEKYLIKPGDTLGKISSQVYGSQGKWRKIWENNKQLIRDPNKIFAGFYLYYVADPGSTPNSPAPLAGSGGGAAAAPAPLDSGFGNAAPPPIDGRDPAGAPLPAGQ